MLAPLTTSRHSRQIGAGFSEAPGLLAAPAGSANTCFSRSNTSIARNICSSLTSTTSSTRFFTSRTVCCLRPFASPAHRRMVSHVSLPMTLLLQKGNTRRRAPPARRRSSREPQSVSPRRRFREAARCRPWAHDRARFGSCSRIRSRSSRDRREDQRPSRRSGKHARLLSVLRGQ